MHDSQRFPPDAPARRLHTATRARWVGAWLVALFVCGPSARAFVCGDVTADGRITAADAIYVVNYVFKGGASPEPIECADVNHDYVVTTADVITLVSVVFRSGAPPWCPPEGTAVTHSGCKSFAANLTSLQLPTDRTCMAFVYDGAGTALVTHFNAAFNCCPEEIRMAVECAADTIRIIESEYLGPTGGCDCICLFDLQFSIEHVFGTYHVIVVEPYRPAGDDPLEFEVTIGDLIPIDTFCATRNGYPWMAGPGPSLRIGSTSACKSFAVTPAATDTLPASEDCARYRYDSGAGVLYLDHINAGFNCCPIIGADIDVEGNLITIIERESPDSMGFCHCLCLFDVSYEIWQLPPGQYTIRMAELYLQPGDDALEFVVDLSATPEGSTCVARHHYPWEY